MGIADEGHTFLYYKTLERDANGRYPYELIPNPFYVRPAVTNYTGTQTLRLVMNDAGSDGWGGSQLIVDFSDNTTTRTFQLASGSTQTQTWQHTNPDLHGQQRCYRYPDVGYRRRQEQRMLVCVELRRRQHDI